MPLYQSPPNQSYLVYRASAGAPGKDLLAPPRRGSLLDAGSRITFSKKCQNADTYAFWSSQVLPSGRTEVLTKGGTGFLGASGPWMSIFIRIYPIFKCIYPYPNLSIFKCILQICLRIYQYSLICYKYVYVISIYKC